MITNTTHFCMKRYASVEEIAAELIGRDWTDCTGMRATSSPSKVAFLHDGGGEYAVAVLVGEQWVQVESYTIGWMKTPARVVEALRETIDLVKAKDAPMWLPLRVKFDEPPETHQRCALCA